MRVDLHSHSCYSKDCRSTLENIIDAVSRSRLDALALTDHDELAGALELQRLAPFPVIAGEEVKTSGGEIIGLFLNEWIPPRLSPQETVARIHDQRGIVYIPHPFDRIRGGRMPEDQLDEIADQVDMLEVFNARNALPRFNREALDYARRRGLLAGAGSDAHSYGELGSAYIELPRFDGPRSFLDSARAGRWQGRLSSPAVHVRTRIDVLRNRVKDAKPPDPHP